MGLHQLRVCATHPFPLPKSHTSSKLPGATWDWKLGWGCVTGSQIPHCGLSTGFQEVGWYPGLEQRYRQAIPNATVPNTTCHLPRADAFHMLRDPVNGDIPWPGLIFGLTVLATWCWCTDQVMPQPGLAQPSQAGVAPCPKTVHLDAQGLGLIPGPAQGSPVVELSPVQPEW